MGDICYNPANMKFGVICLNTYGNAIFSPIYITFEIKSDFDKPFVGLYMTRNDFINRSLKFQQGTVYERMAVSPEDLLSMDIELPNLDDPSVPNDFLTKLFKQVNQNILDEQKYFDEQKKKYEEVQNDMQAIAPKAEGEKDIFTTDIDRDSEAYDRVFSCFKMPKDTDEQKAARSAAIQEATKYAAQVPMEVARRAYALMPLIAEVALKGNQNAVTDACVAMMSARNAVLGALLNVRINLGSLKDKDFANSMQAEADELERQACAREQELLQQINKDLRV